MKAHILKNSSATQVKGVSQQHETFFCIWKLLHLSNRGMFRNRLLNIVHYLAKYLDQIPKCGWISNLKLFAALKHYEALICFVDVQWFTNLFSIKAWKDWKIIRDIEYYGFMSQRSRCEQQGGSAE